MAEPGYVARGDGGRVQKEGALDLGSAAELDVCILEIVDDGPVVAAREGDRRAHSRGVPDEENEGQAGGRAAGDRDASGTVRIDDRDDRCVDGAAVHRDRIAAGSDGDAGEWLQVRGIKR